MVENAIFIFWSLKWRHQVKFNLCFIQTTLNFLLYHMQKNLFGYLQYPRSVALQKFWVHLKKGDHCFCSPTHFTNCKIFILYLYSRAVYDFDSEDDNTPMSYDEKRQLSLDINRVRKIIQGALIRTGQKTFFAKVDGPENFGRLW